MPTLPRGTKFIVPKSGHKKYTAIIPQSNGGTKRVSFGDRRYQHYKDRVPKSMGGGKWSKKDHLDKKRRANYRKRHSGIRRSGGGKAVKKKYSPSWFSYHYLW